MPTSRSPVSAAAFATFGELLRYLRTRARLTQRELSIAVGYSEAQVSRLEHNHRPPDLAAIAALFVPALDLRDDPEAVARLLELAAQARGEALPAHLTITRSVEREMRAHLSERAQGAAALPSPRTSFVGREREIKEVIRAVSESRLVTLTGAGGCGKTRLSLQVAAGAAQSFADGACFVALAPIADPTLVPTAVATALDLPAREGSVTGAVANVLRARHMLLVLDNCEHVIEAAGRLADALLASCPRVYVLATSRAPLNVADEVVYRVAPLTLPPQEPRTGTRRVNREPNLGSGEQVLGSRLSALSSVEELMQSEAVQLFIARAQSALPGFALGDDNAQAVAQICRRLDGMPLAIELAAARMNLLTTQQIDQRLDDRFRLLTSIRRAEPRHQSLRLALDWSYDLLDLDERALVARLSVFSGGWSVEAMEAIADVGLQLPASIHHPLSNVRNSLDVLMSLINKSLVTVERRGDTPARFGMLDSVREYAREKLDAAGEAGALRARHLRYFVGFFEQAAPHLHRADQSTWLATFDAEHDNARAALTYACEQVDPEAIELGYRMNMALSHYWHTRGLSAEGHSWVLRLVASPRQPEHSSWRARALALAQWSLPEQRQALLDESVALCQELNDRAALAFVRLQQAKLVWVGADIAASRAAFVESLRLYREVNDQPMVVQLLAEMAEFEQVRLDDRSSAKAHFAESLHIARDLADTRSIALALAHLGDLAIEQGDIAAAQTYCVEALSRSAELGDKEGMSWSLNGLSSAALGLGDAAQAIQLGEESLRLSREWDGGFHVAIRSYWLARAVALSGDHGQARQLHEDNIAFSRRMHFDWGEAASLQELGNIHLSRGDLAQARALHQQSIALLLAGNYGYSLAYALDAFAAICAAEADWQHAAQLLGAADALRQRIHTALLPIERAARERLVARIGDQMGAAGFASARAHGSTLTPQAAARIVGEG
jgi:predicted ATPase/transcriptional regulator with XRE-family HTH domain